MVYLMGLMYIAAGVNHFLNPQLYLRIMPKYLPYPQMLNYISGLAEIILGIGILFESTRSISAWGIILLLIAVYPANFYMYTAQIHIGKFKIPTWMHIIRFFAQLALIVWAYAYTS